MYISIFNYLIVSLTLIILYLVNTESELSYSIASFNFRHRFDRKCIKGVHICLFVESQFILRPDIIKPELSYTM